MRKGLAQDSDGVWWYHSGERRARAKVVTCETCDREFPTQPSARTVFCSTECQRQTCSVCGVRFTPATNRVRYCSDRCKYGEASCETCGKSFTPGRGDRKRFCSNQCAYTSGLAVGFKRYTAEGYVEMKVPEGTPGAGRRGKFSAGWMLEHRFVIQQTLNRPLARHEQVHHINGVKDDNRLENLELWKLKSQVPGVRAADYHCPGCQCK